MDIWHKKKVVNIRVQSEKQKPNVDIATLSMLTSRSAVSCEASPDKSYIFSAER